MSHTTIPIPAQELTTRTLTKIHLMKNIIKGIRFISCIESLASKSSYTMDLETKKLRQRNFSPLSERPPSSWKKSVASTALSILSILLMEGKRK